MPRQPRLDAPGTLFHVMAPGIDRAKIFWKQEEEVGDMLYLTISRFSRYTGKAIIEENKIKS